MLLAFSVSEDEDEDDEFDTRKALFQASDYPQQQYRGNVSVGPDFSTCCQINGKSSFDEEAPFDEVALDMASNPFDEVAIDREHNDDSNAWIGMPQFPQSESICRRYVEETRQPSVFAW